MIYNFEDVNPEDQEQDQQLKQQEEPVIPNYEGEFVCAKTFLQRTSPDTGDNLYDHLTDCLNKILAERPDNVIDFFEEYSRKVKERRYRPETDHLENIYIPPGRYVQAKKFMNLLKPPLITEPSMDPEDEELVDMSKNNMLQLLYFFEQAGVGLPKEEMLCILMAMKQLIKIEPLASIRFWGKIHGLYKNYYVVETELKDEEYMRRNEEQELEEEALLETEPPPQSIEEVQAQALKDIDQGAEEGYDENKTTKVPRPLPPVPIPVVEEVPEPPAEPWGVGVNKKVYYVTQEPGDVWIQLPNVTPKQIRTARLIKKSFTGNLNQEIITWPAFEGTEREYLRAQIARISAGTQISPLGYYTFGGEEGEEEEEEAEEEEEGKGGEMRTSYRENTRFEGIPFNDMIDKSMSFWVHHTQYILPQGRTSWWNPYPSTGGMEEEMGEEEEEGKEAPKIEPETGPPLLTPLSEDASLEAVPPWSVRSSSILTPEYAIAIIRSNLWPGALCFANQGKSFQNIYIGFGHKYIANNFSPAPLPPVEQDYPIGPEIMEMTDPTGAEEEEWRIAHLPKPKPEKEEVEEEEEEEEEEDED